MLVWDWFVYFFIFVPIFLLWIFVLFDIFGGRPDLSGGQKALWILLVFIFPFIGSLVYLALRPHQTQHPTTT